jgi:hypothetical protein
MVQPGFGIGFTAIIPSGIVTVTFVVAEGPQPCGTASTARYEPPIVAAPLCKKTWALAGALSAASAATRVSMERCVMGRPFEGGSVVCLV